MLLQKTERPRALFAGLVLALAITVVASPTSFAATLQDQSNPGPRIGQVAAIGATYFAQTFRAGITGQLNRITLMGCNGEDNLVTVDIRVYNALLSPPNSTPPSLPASSLGGASISGVGLAAIPNKASGCMSSFDISLDTPAAVTAGGLYTFVVSTTTSGVVGDSGLVLQSSDISTYADGNRSRSLDSGATWAAVTTRNIIFTTYVDVGSPPPPVLQQFGRPVVGGCADAAPAHTQLPGAPTGGWGESWAEWMNGGNGGAVCTRTLVYSTGQSRWAVG
jgi:hypothetical protein